MDPWHVKAPGRMRQSVQYPVARSPRHPLIGENTRWPPQRWHSSRGSPHRARSSVAPQSAPGSARRVATMSYDLPHLHAQLPLSPKAPHIPLMPLLLSAEPPPKPPLTPRSLLHGMARRPGTSSASSGGGGSGTPIPCTHDAMAPTPPVEGVAAHQQSAEGEAAHRSSEARSPGDGHCKGDAADAADNDMASPRRSARRVAVPRWVERR